MKATDDFKNTIKKHLDERAQSDELFAVSYGKENKNIDKCINYILGAVKASGCNGFTDDEVFGMAVHYYDEDNLKANKLPSNMKIVVNHQVELSQEDKQKAHEAAIKKAEDEAYKQITHRPKKSKTETDVQQTNLFD